MIRPVIRSHRGDRLGKILIAEYWLGKILVAGPQRSPATSILPDRQTDRDQAVSVA